VEKIFENKMREETRVRKKREKKKPPPQKKISL